MTSVVALVLIASRKFRSGAGETKINRSGGRSAGAGPGLFGRRVRVPGLKSMWRKHETREGYYVCTGVPGARGCGREFTAEEMKKGKQAR